MDQGHARGQYPYEVRDHEGGHERYSHLKRHRVLAKDGLWDLGNKKYPVEILRTLGMEDCNPLFVPSTSTRTQEELDGADDLNAEETSICRRGVGLRRFYRSFRGDRNYVAKELAHALKTPKTSDMARLKTCARSIKGTMDYAVWLPREGDVQALVGYGDSDWANDKVTRKSVSSGVLFLGGCVVMDWSRTQSAPARSSGEAEWHSQVTLASEGLHMKIIIEFLLFDKKKVGYTQYTDSTAAKAIGGRRGVGKLWHL